MEYRNDRAVEAAPTLPELFSIHYRTLVGLAGLLGADDPEDLAQEAFVRLHRRQDRLREPQAALAYLRVTVCNLTRNRARHLRLARLRAPRPQDHQAAAEQLVIVREEHRELLAAVAALPTRQRQALVLRYWLDLSEQEIADTMAVSVGTVKTHASRGLAALKELMGDKRP